MRQAEKKRKIRLDEILERCLVAFIELGTLDLSLDDLSRKVGISKRMLIHYFGGREKIEEGIMIKLEARLRAQFQDFCALGETTPGAAMAALWKLATSPESRNVLLLLMDLLRRAWNGSSTAQLFYKEQQRLWADLLLTFLPDDAVVEEALQVLQGAILTFLITGDREVGRRSLARAVELSQ